jgi:hypothetical protein
MSAILDQTVSRLAVPAPAQAEPQVLALVPELVAGQQWDQIIAEFDEVCQEQLHLFSTARWPSVRQEPMVFRLDGQIVGGALVMIQPLPLRLGAIAVSKWAPMLKRADHPQASAIHAGMIEALVAEYADKRGMMLSVLPRASIEPDNANYAQLRARGFQQGSQLLYPNRYIIDLRLSDAEQRKSFAQKWRYHLSKSEKAALSFEHAGPERLGEFTALYEAMLDRKNFPDHSAYETVPALMATEIAALRPELFFVRHEGEVIAGALIFKAGDRAVYLYGATADKALPLRAGYFIHWHIIRWLRDNTEARWYDLGGTDGNHGLHQFKKGMAGDRGVIRPVPPVANYASRPWPFLVGNGAFMARDTANALRRYVAGLFNPAARPDQARDSGQGRAP